MSSSRSIAAARNRRAGDPPSQPQGKPMTSIASQSAFSQQNYPPAQGKNVRVGKMSAPPPPPVNTNNLPFTKLSISDAIGLITLRLGRVEQFIIEFEGEGGNSKSALNIPENMRLIDNSVLTSMINRLDSLEKKESSNIEIIKLDKELKNNILLIEELKAEIREIKEDMLMINVEDTMINIDGHNNLEPSYDGENFEEEETIPQENAR